jgi:hypothetical protein
MTSFNVTFEHSGAEELQAALEKLQEAAPIQGAGAMLEEAHAIRAASVEIVPVDQGILRASAEVQGPHFHFGSAFVVVGYGGAAAHYAVEQHENLKFKHSPGQQAKFLEQPAREAVTGMENRLAQKLRDRFQRELIT